MDAFRNLIHHDPILVCGIPRTGTSWTGKVLSLAPNVRYVREPLSHGGYAAESGLEGVPYLRSGDDDPAYEAMWRRVLSPHVMLHRRWLLGESRSFLHRLPFWPARLLIKEINCPLALDWLSERFRLRVVVTVRHPCGYVASALRLLHRGFGTIDLGRLLAQPRLMSDRFADDREWLEGLTDPVARLAAGYGMVYKVVSDDLACHPEWAAVRHECLCRRPHDGFRRLARSVGVGFNRAMGKFLDDSSNTPDDELFSLNRVSADEPEKWKAELTAAQVETVASVVARFRLPFYRDFA